MSESCTLYCRNGDLSTVLAIGRDYGDELSVTGPEADWSTAVIQGNGSTLRLTPLIYRERADKFTKLRLSTYMWADGCKSVGAAVDDNVLSHIQKCVLILGVVAEPDFETDGRFFAGILELARQLDGLVFDGARILDSLGNVVCEEP